MRILAIDPGVTTGYAFAQQYETTNEIKVQYDQRIMSVLEYFNYLRAISPDCLVIEDFEYRRGNAKDSLVLFSVELIGVTRLYCAEFSVQLYVQKASIQGKNSAYFSDDRLKEMDLYVKGVEHGRSAVKHLLHWFHFGAGYPQLGARTFIWNPAAKRGRLPGE